MTNPDSVRLPSYLQNPRVLPLGEWSPDTPDYSNPGMTVARNCVPLSQSSYGPLPALASLSGFTALADAPLGLFSYLDREGTDHIFAGTAAKLYHYQTGDSGFVDVTNPDRTYSASSFDPWSMTAFGNAVIATNGVDPPQVFAIDSGATTFTDLATDAPLGKYTATVRDFVFLANTTEETPDSTIFPQRVHWSAIGNPGYWPEAGTNQAQEVQSDFTDLRADLGHIQGIASGLQSADVAIFLDGGVYTGIYTTAPVEFSFQLAQGATGCAVPGSIIVNRGYAYYLGHDGFYAFDGTTPTGIGNQKVDRWFFNDASDGADPKYLFLTQGSADPSGKLIYWSYCGPSSNGVRNRLLIFNWSLGRWSMARVSVGFLGRGITTGLSLDQLDQFGTMDTLPFSLDSPVWQGGNPLLMAFDPSNNVCSFSGANLAASMETLETQPTPGRRSRVTAVRPLVDGGTPTCAIGSRNRLEDAVSYSSAVAVNWYGESPQRSDARYIRAQVNIPAATVWTHCLGAEIDFAASLPR